MLRMSLFLMCSLMLSTGLSAAELSVKQKYSYSIGHQMGQSLKGQGVDVDQKMLIKAIEDVLGDKKPDLSPQQMQEAMNAFREHMMAQRSKAAEENKKKSEAFLAENAKKPGIKSTASGLQYKVVQEGTGPKPKLEDRVKVHYHGTLLDHSVFDSSVDRGEPATFPLSGVVKGWQEALQLMPVGSKYTVYVPSNLAYGERGAGGKIGPNAALVFDIELLGIETGPSVTPIIKPQPGKPMGHPPAPGATPAK